SRVSLGHVRRCRIALGPTDTGHCVMAFRSYSAILASLLLSSLIAAPAVAVCKSPKNICKHIDECLQRTSDPNVGQVTRISQFAAVVTSAVLRRPHRCAPLES